MDEESNVSGVISDVADPVGNQSTELNEAQDRQVPLDALKAERAERQRLQEELSMMRDNMKMLMAQQNQPKPTKADEFDGLTDDDVLTVGELKKALSNRESQYKMSIEELRMSQKHPDYQEVVTKYLPDVLKQNPSLLHSLQQTNDYELAYHLAKNSDAYKQSQQTVKRNADAERIVQNANQSGSLSSVGQTSPISQAKRYRDMSNDEFMRAVHKNLGYS